MRDIFDELGLSDEESGVAGQSVLPASGGWLESTSPIDGKRLGRVRLGTVDDYEKVVKEAMAAYERWRLYPAPKRGELVRQMGMLLREKKRALGRLVTLEVGKIVAEGEGEVQEMIDIADFAVGLSRQLYGLSITSERPLHRMSETWHPLGLVGIISAFNFPVAVWSWNAFLAAVCGNVMIWKPSPKTPLTAIAVHKLVSKVLGDAGFGGVMGLCIGENETVGERLINDDRVALVSATGSTRMGKHVGETVAKRFGKTLLELGGNNALTVMADANQDLALRAVLFGAVGTAGQRCTTTRRLLLQKPIHDAFLEKLVAGYRTIPIGNPLESGVLMGPLVDTRAVESMQKALEAAKAEGGEVVYGGKPLSGAAYPGGRYVEPAIVKAHPKMPIVREETFAPILYVMSFETLEDAIRIQNDVPQGLSSAVFTESLRTAERFLSAVGSDCGIANVNLGTSGAEIGGAFGGEKQTGGGRESGSDSWRAYMRRQTQTINWSSELPLAQGIKFSS